MNIHVVQFLSFKFYSVIFHYLTRTSPKLYSICVIGNTILCDIFYLIYLSIIDG